MSKTEVQSGVPLQQSAHDDTGGCNACLGCIAYREDQAILASALRRENTCRMNKDGGPYLLTCLPEWFESRIVEISAQDVGSYFDAGETQRIDHTPNLLGSAVGILHRHRAYPGKMLRICCDALLDLFFSHLYH